ncbi:MAG: acyl-CoA dehydrogenase family protein [Microthrixaceae bacterium]
MASDLVERARELYDTLDGAAAALAPGEPVPRSVMDLIVDAGLYGLMVPKAAGGQELPLTEVVDVYEEISRADGSIGWVHFACDLTASYFGAYLAEEGAAEVFGDGVPLMAGQFAPNGTATPMPDDREGWLMDGDYQFGSGIAVADWAGGGILATPADGGDPSYLFACMPVEHAQVTGNWDVLGLQATASYDYRVRDLFVPATRTFDFFAPIVHRGGPRYELGVIPLTAAGHAGWALGVQRRVLDELAARASVVRMGAPSALAESEHFLISLADLESRYQAGRAWVREVLVEAEAVAAHDGAVDELTANRVRQACTFVNRGGARLAEEAYLLAGTSALRDGPMQRAFRDLHAGSQHFFASHAASVDYARSVLATGRS